MSQFYLVARDINMTLMCTKRKLWVSVGDGIVGRDCLCGKIITDVAAVKMQLLEHSFYGALKNNGLSGSPRGSPASH